MPGDKRGFGDADPWPFRSYPPESENLAAPWCNSYGCGNVRTEFACLPRTSIPCRLVQAHINDEFPQRWTNTSKGLQRMFFDMNGVKDYLNMYETKYQKKSKNRFQNFKISFSFSF